jgi:hypothetical protein
VGFEAAGINEGYAETIKRVSEARARLLQEPDLTGVEEAA